MTLPPPQIPKAPPAPAAAPAVVHPSKAPPPVAMDQAALASSRFWDQLRRVRADLQGAQTSLEKLRQSGASFEQVLVRERHLWAQNASQVDVGIAQALQDEQSGAAGGNEIADELAHLDNDWERAKFDWQSFVDSPPPEGAERTRQLDELDGLLRGMVKRIGFLTIPGRVGAWLERQRIGGRFDFHAAFRDELPIQEDRVELLGYLRSGPVGIDGVVDVDEGIIWATSPDPAVRRRSYLVLAAIFVAGLAGLGAAAHFNLGGPFVPGRRDELLIAYLAVAAGVVIHVFIDVRKQSQLSTKTSSWTAVDDLVLWGHAHQKQLYLTGLSIVAGTIGLALVFAKIEPATALIAGYSLDSVLDAFLLRFSNTIESGTAAIRKQATG